MSTNAKLSKLYSKFEELKAQLEEYANEARDKYDNGSERWQESDNGAIASDKADNLEQAVSEMESLMETLSSTFENA